MHRFESSVVWRGNRGEGTAGYRAYDRDFELSAKGKSAAIAGSSDPMFRGDGSRYNPEELLVASIASCHMLWYLHLCADAGIVVDGYTDDAFGTLRTHPDGAGEFTDVVLRPRVTLRSPGDAVRARSLHDVAHERCFIARSVNFPVRCEPTED